MRTKEYIVRLAMVLVLLVAGRAVATSSTTYWTPGITDVQPFGVWHIGIDNYFTVDKTKASGLQSSFPTDVGLTVGVLPWEKVQMEVGVDALYSADNPFYVNAKIGMPENALFTNCPAFNVGIFNVGTKKGLTDYNIVDLIVGRTLPWNLGRFFAGVYAGNHKVLVNGSGESDNTGWMVAWNSPTFREKWILAADYASGDNAIGGGGVGVYYCFTKDVSLLVGPVWFNESAINGSWKMTTQLDINF